jgi:hypothetical protein
MKRLFYIVGILALVQPAMAQTVLESDFTITVPNTSGDPVVESTTLVPLLEGTCYDWHLKLAKIKGEVEVTEIYTLPAAPQTWDLGEESLAVISEDQRTATTPLTLTPQDGWIASGWCVSEGDPQGDYRIEVRAGDTVLEAFEFELRAM